MAFNSDPERSVCRSQSGTLEQDIQAATAGARSHDTSADTTGSTARGVVSAIVVLLWRVSLLLRRVVHRLLLLGIVALLLLWVPLSLLRVVALLGLAAAIVVRCGTWVLIVRTCVMGGRRV